MKAASESLEAQNQAAEIKVRAERKAGELIAKMEKAKKGNRHIKNEERSSAEPSKTKQLESIGVSKTQAHRLEQMAAVPDETFEELADYQMNPNRSSNASNATRLNAKNPIRKRVTRDRLDASRFNWSPFGDS